MVVGWWLVIGVAGLVVRSNASLVARLYPLGALGSLALSATALWSLQQPPNVAVLLLGLPDLPFHLRLDALSALFLVLLGAASVGVSLFAAGYFRHEPSGAAGLLCLQYHIFLAAMALVLVADDAYMFMVAWETMALASYFLVTTDHKVPTIRSAGFLYLLIAHVGAVGILLCFGVMQGGHGDYTFATMRQAHLSENWASAAFLLALFGFGAKAGLLPVHTWLPEAHPAAPSPVSAIMSGVMLKTAVYGLLRVSFDLLDAQMWWWGVVLLTLGLLTALFGVIFAAVQTDMKRLLAYSSIENIGIVAVGIGLAMIFHAYHLNMLAALALTAALYHCLNHAFFKSLLFLGTGHVLHASGERNLGKLGGLIHRMPWLSAMMLIGILAIAALPPFNGFVSEWLLLQAFLFSPSLPNSYLVMLVPVAAAALVLASALAAYVMVKFYGVVFLGQPREEKLKNAHDVGPWQRAGLLWLAFGCIALGLLPIFVISWIDPATSLLVEQSLGNSAAHGGWLFLTPVSAERASYSPVLFVGVIIAIVLLAAPLMKYIVQRREVRRGAAWDCGYPLQNACMQDTAEGFGQPIKQIFEPFFRIERHLPSAFDAQPHYHAKAQDRLWYWLYLPLARVIDLGSLLVGKLQHGRIYLYLLYSFLTLLALLMFVR